MNHAGYYAGTQFGYRISPAWIKAGRMYYSGGHDDLNKAKKHIRKGEWDKASAIWKRLAAAGDTETKGRACYNMAIAAEVEDDIDGAIEWAQKAKKLNIAEAASYINVLHQRKMDRRRLDEQMGGGTE